MKQGTFLVTSDSGQDRGIEGTTHRLERTRGHVRLHNGRRRTQPRKYAGGHFLKTKNVGSRVLGSLCPSWLLQSRTRGRPFQPRTRESPLVEPSLIAHTRARKVRSRLQGHGLAKQILNMNITKSGECITVGFGSHPLRKMLWACFAHNVWELLATCLPSDGRSIHGLSHCSVDGPESCGSSLVARHR